MSPSLFDFIPPRRTVVAGTSRAAWKEKRGKLRHDHLIVLHFLREHGAAVHDDLVAAGRRGGKGGGAFSFGHYRFVSPQPGDEQMRTSKAWNAWCEANKDQQIAIFKSDLAGNL